MHETSAGRRARLMARAVFLDMAYAVVAYLDPEAERSLATMLDVLTKLEIPTLLDRVGWRPRLTFAAVLQVDSTNMRMELKRYATHLDCMAVRLGSGRTFGGERLAIGLAAERSPELEAAHQGLYRFLHKVAQSPRPEFGPGRWEPALHLAEDLSPGTAADGAAAIAPMEPPAARITEIAVIQVNPVRENVVFSMPLAGGAFRDRS